MNLLLLFIVFAAPILVNCIGDNETDLNNPATLLLSTGAINTTQVNKTNNVNALNLDHPVKFIVHGWTEDAERPHYIMMKDVYLDVYEDVNVIRVDWRNIASKPYLDAANGVKQVGQYVGEFISFLHHNHNVPISNFHIIGHSLGAQVAGCAGRTVASMTGLKLPRITGLDPARPNFEANYIRDDNKLTYKDATMVDIVHTDAGFLGYEHAFGGVDFFPNGGFDQPGCATRRASFLNTIVMGMTFQGWNTHDLYCSHAKSVLYFTASINSTDIKAIKCDAWDIFNKGTCKNNPQIVFGEHMPLDVKGTYYFKL